jgi:hypothetical protein
VSDQSEQPAYRDVGGHFGIPASAACRPPTPESFIVRERRLSAVSWYLTIRSDGRYSRYAATAPLVEFLAAMPELRQTGVVAFEAAAGQPWVAVVLATCNPAGNYASDGAFVPAVNVVELVCSDSDDPAWYEALAGRIAGFLGWTACNDHEQRQVWPPAGPRPVGPGASGVRSRD